MDEYKLLIHILEFCERNGATYKTVTFDIDHTLIEELYDRHSIQPTLDELKVISDRCYAREWIERSYIGSGNYKALRLTSKGFGVAISKRKAEEDKANRTPLKKASDYIEDHKGVFVMVGLLIAVAGVAATFLAGASTHG